MGGNVGQVALGIVGGVIGFFVGGGPMGAAYGFQLGYLAGSADVPTRMPSEVRAPNAAAGSQFVGQPRRRRQQ